MICPDCQGKGIIIGMFPRWADHVPQEDRKPFIEMACTRCRGEKEVPDEQQRWIERGRDLRQARVDAKIGLCEFCKQNNISPLDRSQMERGVVDPDTFIPKPWKPTGATE